MSRKSPTILRAMSDPALFGPWFKGNSWNNWKTFLRVLFSLPLSKKELATFSQFTGRQSPPSNVREAWLCVGRRAGKSLIAALVAVFLACFVVYAQHLAPGELGTIMIIASDRRQARTIMRYVRAFFEIPMLASMVMNQTKGSITLSNKVMIEIHTSNYKAVRGYSLVAVLADEVAFWRSETSANPDKEILNALRPGLATVPGSILLCLSSPYSRRGELWRTYRKHYGEENDNLLVWQSDTQSMNPTIPQAVIDRAYEEDPSSAAAEYGGLFRTDVESYIHREAVEAVIVPDRHELPPIPNVGFFGFCDPSGGAQDSFTLAIGHRENRKVILDLVREVRPPFSPESVTEEFSRLLKSYRIHIVTGDRYGGQWPREQFAKNGIHYITSDKTKSVLYQEFLPIINSSRVELLDNSRLLNQLLGLERRTARSGRDSIDHAPKSHDDISNVVAGVVVVASQYVPYSPVWSGDPHEQRMSRREIRMRIGRPHPAPPIILD